MIAAICLGVMAACTAALIISTIRLEKAEKERQRWRRILDAQRRREREVRK